MTPLARGAILLATFTLAGAAVAQAQAQSQPRLPDSAQGRVAEAVIQAYNAGEAARLEAVLAQHGTPAMAAVRPFMEWTRVLLEVRNEDFGPVRIDRVFAVHETVLVALVEGDKGPWMDFRFEFEPKGSPRLTRIRLEPSDPPR
jgi:hypothetical protein